jgi:hypothetical protein
MRKLSSGIKRLKPVRLLAVRDQEREILEKGERMGLRLLYSSRLPEGVRIVRVSHPAAVLQNFGTGLSSLNLFRLLRPVLMEPIFWLRPTVQRMRMRRFMKSLFGTGLW